MPSIYSHAATNLNSGLKIDIIGCAIKYASPSGRSKPCHSGRAFSWNDIVCRVYILENTKGKFYIGQTENLKDRLVAHNDPNQPMSKYTRKNGLWRLVWQEMHSTRSSAVRRERQIKRMKSSRWIRENLLGRGG